MAALSAGTSAPAFSLASTPEERVALADYRGRPVILVFYPADWSPVCGDQLALYNELRDEFNTVEKIRSDPRFRKFLRWLYKQQEGTFFRTRRNRNRRPQKYQ